MLIAALIRGFILIFFLNIHYSAFCLSASSNFIWKLTLIFPTELLQASEEASLLMSSPRMLLPASGALPPGAPLSVHHQIQLLQQQLQQQQQQTQVAVAQVTSSLLLDLHVT